MTIKTPAERITELYVASTDSIERYRLQLAYMRCDRKHPFYARNRATALTMLGLLRFADAKAQREASAGGRKAKPATRDAMTADERYEDGVKATQAGTPVVCERCGNWLMGSEMYGTVCNVCLELQGAIANRQRLKARVQELGSEFSQLNCKITRLEGDILAEVRQMTLIGLAQSQKLLQLGATLVQSQSERDGLNRLLNSARTALETAKQRCKALDAQPLPNREVGAELAATQSALIAAERAYATAQAKDDPATTLAAVSVLRHHQAQYQRALEAHTTEGATNVLQVS